MVLFLSSSDVDKVVSTFTSDDLTNLMARVFFSLSSSTSPNSNSDPSSNRPRDFKDSKVSKGEPKEVDSICLPHRLSVPTTNHTALFMPSRMTPFGTAMKVVSVPSASAPDEIKQKGLPASTIVLDEITGEVKALVNASKLTALRNAAGTYGPNEKKKKRKGSRELIFFKFCWFAISNSTDRF